MTPKRIYTKRRGFVVVFVLCMTIMLGVLLVGFNYKSRANLCAVDNLRKAKQALNCARAGLNIAIAAIRDANDIHTNKTLLNLLTGETFDVGEGKCSINITDENGAFNVNLLKDKKGRLNRARIEQLLRLIDLLNQEHTNDGHIGYGLVPSIVDWTDQDNEVTSLPFIKYEHLGAESSYYGKLQVPYRCKNAPFDTTEELLLVKGITPQIFDRIRDYVTVYSDGKININSASKQVIMSLSEKMNPALTQIIIDRRKFKPFRSITELKDVPGMTDSIYYAISQTATTGPTDQYYHVISRGNVDDLTRAVRAILRRNMKTKNVEVVLYKEL